MKLDILEHGYVELIEPYGTGKTGRVEGQQPDYEVGIIEAARQSTQGSFRGWSEDAKLLRYLYNNRHNTPFEFAGLIIEVRAPIFVFREWHRHRTQSYNEMSARYAPLPALDYLPTCERLMIGGGHLTKQAAGLNGIELTGEAAMQWLSELEDLYRHSRAVYANGLNLGVPKELARLAVTVGGYTQMRASANLRNWLAFMTLRADPHAQWEIQQYANAVGYLIGQRFPQTWKLYSEAIEKDRAA